LDFIFGPSPSPDVVLSRYDAALFPKFRFIFQEPGSDRRFQRLAQGPEEANTSVVMENRADKDITALRYYWAVTDENGSEKKHTASSDSYTADVYDPVLRAGDRKLICRRNTVDESLIEHVLGGGSTISVSFESRREPPVNVSSLRLDIDMLLFADGEIAGPDTDNFAAELRCRKTAALFIAKQIRLAEAEGRDVTPVLTALAEMPRFGRPRYAREDPMVNGIERYARQYMWAMRHPPGPFDRLAAQLRHLENQLMLPKFYRRESGSG
jgi:hypothetical protein